MFQANKLIGSINVYGNPCFRIGRLINKVLLLMKI